MRARLFLLALLAAASGCKRSAMTAGGPGEPMLTNPVRLDTFLGEEEARPLEDWQHRYEGGFRLPLTEDWTWELPDEGRWALSRMELGAPAVHADQLLVGSSRKSGLFVLDRTEGRLKTVVKTPGPVQAAPLRLTRWDDRTVEVPIAGTDQVMERTESVEVHDGWIVVDTFGTVLRLDADLEPVWEQPYEAGGGIYRTPVLDGEELLLSTARDTVSAISLADGAWQWSYKREVARTSMELAILGAPAPVVDGDQVYAGFSDGAVVAMARTSGRLLWEVQVGSGQFPDIEAEVVVEGDLVVAAAYGGPVVGIDKRTRRVSWEVPDAGAVSSMESAGGSIYTADGKGRVHAIEPMTGAIEWMWERPGKLFGPPRRAGGSILVGDVDGTLYALDRFEGQLQWQYRPADGTRLAGVAAPITLAGRQVLFPTAGGVLYSLVAESGRVMDHSEEPAWRADREIGW